MINPNDNIRIIELQTPNVNMKAETTENINTKLISSINYDNDSNRQGTRVNSQDSIRRTKERKEASSRSYTADSFRELSIISRHEKMVKKQLNLKHNHVKWTINDQMRLVALDALHAKEKEFHNLIPSFDSLAIIDLTKENCLLDDLAFKVVFCSTDPNETSKFYGKAKEINSNTVIVQQPLCFTHRDMNAILPALDLPKDGFLWIQLQDLASLNEITSKYNLHTMVKTSFTDLRTRSTYILIKQDHSFVLSLTYCHLRSSGSSCAIAKLFIYVSKSLVMTYESEVLKVEDDNDDDFPDLETLMYNQDIINSINSKLDHLLPELKTHGVTYLLYSLAMEGLRLQDPLVEFCSRSISFHKKLLDKVQNDINNSFIFRKVRILESSLVLIRSQIITSVNAIDRCMGGQGKKVKSNISNEDSSFTTNDQLICRVDPYLNYALDAYYFVEDTIIRKVEEVRGLHGDMQNMSQLVTARIALLLSLYFSLFVPLNFLTGIFGMNFQPNNTSDYTIAILNDPMGIYYFWLLCLGILLMTITLLVYGGLIEPSRIISALTDSFRFSTSSDAYRDEKEAANIEDANRAAIKSAQKEELIRGQNKRGSISRRTLV